MFLLEITPDVNTDIWLNLGIWGLLGYTIYKDGKEALQTYFKNKNELAQKAASTQKKDAESLRQERIDTTLLNVEDFFNVFTKQTQKHVDEVQAKIIIKGALTVTRLDILTYVAKQLMYLQSNSVGLFQQIETSNNGMIYDLSKFTYKDVPLITYITPKFAEELLTLLQVIIIDGIQLEIKESHRLLHKAIGEYYDSLYIKTIQKFV